MTKDELVTLIRDHKDYEGRVDEFELADTLLAAGASEGQARTFKRYDWNGQENEHGALVFFHDVLEAVAIAESAEIAALREALKGAAVIANAAGAEIKALRERIAKYQAVCAAAYQLVGAVDGPVRFLDALSNAANGEPASVEDSLALLPAEPSERIAGMEKDAGPRHWNPVYNTDPVQRACGELPEGIEIEIQLERDSGTVYLVDNNCGERHMIDDADTFNWTVHKAIDAAIAKEEPK